MRPQGTPQQLETRRRRAIALLKAGKTYLSVAATVSSSVSSVVRWFQSFRKNGLKGLQPRPAPGRPPRLSKSRRRKLLRLLERGPLAAGYQTDLWTLKRIAELIERHFGVRYHPSHVWKLMVGFDWSCQKPERRALERDEKAIAHWKRYNWSHVKKNPTTWRPSRISRRKRVSAHSQRP